MYYPFSVCFRPRTLCDCEGSSKRNSGKVLRSSIDGRPACKPVNNILFLKVHKTGSSTVTNILNRFGDSRELLFALPVNGNHFNWPHLFLLNYAMPIGRTPNILSNHARFNKAPMHWLFPKGTTRYITLLREPTKQFESVFNYYQFAKRFQELQNVTPTFDSFLQNAEFFLKKGNGSGLFNLLKNPTLFDLGLDTKYHRNRIAVRNYIRFLQQEFDLVMLMEYYDESLVLLKRRFCWKTEDILYFKQNERTDKEKQKITSHTRKLIQKWNSADVFLYDVFNQTLWEMIKQEGSDFYKDLALFRKEKETMEKTCLQEGEFLTSPFTGKQVRGYAVKTSISKEMSEICTKMIMNEVPYMNYLREKLIKRQEDVDISANQMDLLQ